ncbi:MAG TPA: AAA family ATPase [Opitutaceae bacterium]|nr:AAA family ATPase [Opitutaceae bacterium]
MILLAVELTHVGRFRETIRLGPFERGITVLAAPNESGKSTVMRAVARALFDKHTTRGDEIKSLQPAGTDLAPRIAVEFATQAGRFRIEKTFLQSPRSLLRQEIAGSWQTVAEGDGADLRLQELLQSTLPGRGATRPEHWGFFGFLWARQGEPTAWPALDEEGIGQRIRSQLARVEIDPVIEALRQQLSRDADTILTSTGQPKAGGALRVAEDDLAAIEQELASLRRLQSELEASQRTYQNALQQVALLEKEHEDKKRIANETQALAQKAEGVKHELETRQVEFTTAREKLSAIVHDYDLLQQRAKDCEGLQSKQASGQAAIGAAEHRVSACRTQREQAQSARPHLENKVQSLRQALQRVQSLLKYRSLLSQHRVLLRQTEQASETVTRIQNLRAELSRLPNITPAKLRSWEELADRSRSLRAQLDVAGLEVILTPDQDSAIQVAEALKIREEILSAGKSVTLRSPQSIDLLLPGWGRVVIHSGAVETKTLSKDLTAAESRLQEELKSEGLASVPLAREAVARSQELSSLVRSLETALKQQLESQPSLDLLKDSAARLLSRADALEASLALTPAEREISQTELESEDARLAQACPAAEAELAALDQKLARLHTEEREAGSELQRVTQAHHTLSLTLQTVQSQMEALKARYLDGLDAARSRAQVHFAEAEARWKALQAQLPPDFEKLPERNRRATSVLQQVANELQQRRAERDQAQGALESLGGQGLYSRETDLEEKRVEATLRRNAARLRGTSARMGQLLIDFRKEAATRSVLQPLEDRLTSAFAEMSGVQHRKVFLDDSLRIVGIGPSRDSTHRFEDLSQGAKEQLLLCLRIAVAQELATKEPQTLILDDSLVNTDPARQIRIGEGLASLAKNLQVIVLTCHSDRYRDFQQISLSP